jgi:hypothetical protein
MKVIKADGRYKLYDKGFTHIISFRYNSDRKLYTELVKEFTQMYGPVRIQDAEKGATVWNEDWRYEVNVKSKRRRIYLKNDSVLSLILLTMGAKNGV